MQIKCPECSKVFLVDDELIPPLGRVLQCGGCGFKWHYKFEQPIDIINKKDVIFEKTITADNNIIIEEELTSIKEDSRDHEIHNKLNINILKSLKYLIVFIITVASIVIILDTFKMYLILYFPDLENLLNNLYESIRDITLFFRDLI